MDANEFWKSFAKLGSAYVTEYTRNVERYFRFVSGMAQQPSGAAMAGNAQERYVEFMRTEAPRISGALAEASLNYYTALINTGIDAANRFFEQVVQTERPAAPARADSRQPPALLFRGRHGESPANAFLVSNNRNQAIEVRFEVTEISNEDGTVRFQPVAKFVPEVCQLAPNSEKLVQCSILLTEQYQPGEIHRAQIRVVGIPEMTMKISVHVDGTKE
jgi:hypothetical protein